MSESAAWISFAQIAAAFLSPVIGAATAVFTINRRESDKFVGGVDWIYDYDDDYGPIEIPILYIQNRSDHTIHITSVGYRRGVFFRKHPEYTGLQHEDPLDLNFPYEIEPGTTRQFRMDSGEARRTFGEARWIDAISNFLRRSPLVVSVRTMSGKERRFDAIRLVPYNDRPNWAK